MDIIIPEIIEASSGTIIGGDYKAHKYQLTLSPELISVTKVNKKGEILETEEFVTLERYNKWYKGIQNLYGTSRITRKKLHHATQVGFDPIHYTDTKRATNAGMRKQDGILMVPVNINIVTWGTKYTLKVDLETQMVHVIRKDGTTHDSFPIGEYEAWEAKLKSTHGRLNRTQRRYYSLLGDQYIAVTNRP